MILYYAHSHGNGHCNYARQFASAAKDCIIATDSNFVFPASCEVLKLENEDTGDHYRPPGKSELPTYLHHSPVGLGKITRRTADLLLTAVARDVRLVLVDVSVEIAALCRVASIPYAYRRMSGDRNDLAHTEAYRGASLLYAYYPEEFENPRTPDWIKNKTIYAGFVTDKRFTPNVSPTNSSQHDIVVIQGKGGHSFTEQSFQKLRKDFPRSAITTLGEYSFGQMDDLHFNKGIVADIAPFVQRSDLVIASCGSNITSELLALNTKFIAIAEDRPYDEQIHIAESLESNRLAIRLQNHDFLSAADRLSRLPPGIPKTFHPRTMTEFVDKLNLATSRWGQTIASTTTHNQKLAT